MPLYELLCLARPAMQRQAVARMIAAAGELVQASGGVVMDVTNYGEQPLAYRIRGVHGKFDKAHIWQLDFAVTPETLAELKTQMRINEDVLRWVVVKRHLPKPPGSRELFHELSPHAAALRPRRPGDSAVTSMEAAPLP